jgi:aspartate carbamoyltransferase catalytic subunit
MGDDVKADLLSRGVSFEEETDLLAVLPDVDVVYQTRVQHERFESDEEYREARGKYVIDAAAMAALSPDAIVMHPLPRVDEIDPIVDTDRRAAYFRQARNGIYVRMAILDWLLRDE